MKEIVSQLIELLNNDQICVSFEWIGTETRGQEIWGATYMDEKGKIRIIVDINRMVCYAVLHEFLHWVMPQADEAEIWVWTNKIYQDLDFATKQKIVQAVKDNAKRRCGEY
jgi:hypothetical protein